MENFYKKRIDIKKKAITELNIKMPHSATCVTGKWKIELTGMRLSACPKARSMLGVSTYGTFGLRDFFNLLDDHTLIKFKIWMQSICHSAVLEPVIFDVHMDNMTSQAFKITGFHYSEDWDLPSTIIGVLEDITQNVQEDRIALSIINHEMRTPLSVMKLNAQMIQRSAVKFYPASPSEMAFNIERHIDSITNILDQYLSGVGDACDNIKINATVFDLSCLINQVLNDMRGLYPEYLFINNARSTILIKADRYLVLRVLINYLNNAVQHSPVGSFVTIDVKKKNDFVEVSVADEGSGIHELDLPYVFDRFYKAGPEIAKPGASKGLGLFMVKQIIAKHHGEVFVKSSGKGGSIFYFTLPGYVE